MNKLIIGCGYLGRRVARLWQHNGDTVFALTRSPANAEELRSLGIEPIVGDVTNGESLRQLPSADVVLCAVGFDRSAAASQRDVYVDGLTNAAREPASRVNRLIYISSTSVYGQSAGEWIDEQSPTNPTRENGRICLEAENVLRNAHQGRELSWNILRLAGIYGPGRLLQRVASLKAGATLDGNPDAFLNFIHVDDAARAVLACEKHGHLKEMYLVCDDRPIRRRDYYEKLATLVGAPEPSYSQAAGQESSEGFNKRCSNRKLREHLHLALQYPNIDVGLPHAVGAIPKMHADDSTDLEIYHKGTKDTKN